MRTLEEGMARTSNKVVGPHDMVGHPGLVLFVEHPLLIFPPKSSGRFMEAVLGLPLREALL